MDQPPFPLLPVPPLSSGGRFDSQPELGAPPPTHPHQHLQGLEGRGRESPLTPQGGAGGSLCREPVLSPLCRPSPTHPGAPQTLLPPPTPHVCGSSEMNRALGRRQKQPSGEEEEEVEVQFVEAGAVNCFWMVRGRRSRGEAAAGAGGEQTSSAPARTRMKTAFLVFSWIYC